MEMKSMQLMKYFLWGLSIFGVSIAGAPDATSPGQDIIGKQLRKSFHLPELPEPFPKHDGWSWEQRETHFNFRVIGLEPNQFQRCQLSIFPRKHLEGEDVLDLHLLYFYFEPTALTSDEIHRFVAKAASKLRSKYRMTVIFHPIHHSELIDFENKIESVHGFATLQGTVVLEQVNN